MTAERPDWVMEEAVQETALDLQAEITRLCRKLSDAMVATGRHVTITTIREWTRRTGDFSCRTASVTVYGTGIQNDYIVRPDDLKTGRGMLLTPEMVRPRRAEAIPAEITHRLVVRCASCRMVTRVLVDASGGAIHYPRSLMEMAAEALARLDHGRDAATHQFCKPLLERREEGTHP